MYSRFLGMAHCMERRPSDHHFNVTSCHLEYGWRKCHPSIIDAVACSTENLTRRCVERVVVVVIAMGHVCQKQRRKMEHLEKGEQGGLSLHNAHRNRGLSPSAGFHVILVEIFDR